MHVSKLSEYLISRRRIRLCIIIDNADQFSDSIQEKIFLLSQSICRRSKALVIISLREGYYYQWKNYPPFNAFQSNAYHITAPPYPVSYTHLMGNIFWSKTTFEVAVAEFIATGDIRKTDNEVGFSFILVSQLLTSVSYTHLDVYKRQHIWLCRPYRGTSPLAAHSFALIIALVFHSCVVPNRLHSFGNQ